jgi:hypothetical protein
MQRFTWPAVVVAAALATMAPTATGAATPSALEIVSTGSVLDRSTIHPGPGLGTAEATLTGGSFDASGVIEGSGPMTMDVVFSGAAAPNSDVVHGTAIFTGEAGSFSLQFQALHLPFDNPVFDGRWVLAGGTGAYTGLHGTGTVEFDVHGELGPNPIVDAAWTGKAHAAANGA